MTQEKITQEKAGDWMQEMQDEQEYERKPKLRIGDGEQVEITFLDEGTKITSQYGESILLNVKENNVEKVWFVNTNKYTLLREIKKSSALDWKNSQAHTHWKNQARHEIQHQVPNLRGKTMTGQENRVKVLTSKHY